MKRAKIVVGSFSALCTLMFLFMGSWIIVDDPGRLTLDLFTITCALGFLTGIGTCGGIAAALFISAFRKPEPYRSTPPRTGASETPPAGGKKGTLPFFHFTPLL
jgi:hypothetical protein